MNKVQSIIAKRLSRLLNYLFLFFFCFLLELSGNFKTKRINSIPIQIIEEQKSKVFDNIKIMLNLIINDHSFLSHIIVPFFNKLNFLTKKRIRL